MKKYLIAYYGDAPECVEGFHKDAKRSCKGALHVSPGRKLTVTQDELDKIKKDHSHMMPKLRILSVKDEAKKERVHYPKKAKKKESKEGEKEGSKEEPKALLPAQDEGEKKKKKKKKN